MRFLRFVNTVSQSKLDTNVIWSHVKDLRFKYLKKNIDLTCFDNLIPDEYISSNSKHLTQLIGIYSLEDEVNDNLSPDIITSGAEMFWALNSCPSKFVRLYWKAIYAKGSNNVIMATLTNLKKSNNDFKKDAMEIFAKVDSALGSKYLSSQRDGTQNIDRNFELWKNVSIVKGNHML